MEEEKREIKSEELEIDVLDAGVDSEDIGTRGVCCTWSIFPARW